MKREVNPQETSRSSAFTLWMSSPMPMVTLVKTIDVSRLVKYSKKHKLSFNMLTCWCIGKAASPISEFYLLPENGRMYQYDRLAINVIVKNRVAPSIHATSRLGMTCTSLPKIINT